MSAMRNGSGYVSPTETAAIHKIEEETAADNRAALLIRVLRNLIELCGFTLVNRIEVRDRITGRVYK